MKWLLVAMIFCSVSHAEWKESDVESVVLVTCESALGVHQGSGIVIDKHLVLTARHVVRSCRPIVQGDQTSMGVEVHDGPKSKRRPNHFVYNKMGGDTHERLEKAVVSWSQDFAILVFEQPLITRPISLELDSHLESPDDLMEGEYSLVGFPHTFSGKRAEGHFDTLRVGASRAVQWSLCQAKRTNLYPLIRGLFLEVEIEKKGMDHFLPGLSGGAVLDKKRGKLLGIVVGFFDEIDPKTKFGVAIDFTHPVRRVALRKLKERFPYVLKETQVDFGPSHSEMENLFSKKLYEIFKLL